MEVHSGFNGNSSRRSFIKTTGTAAAFTALLPFEVPEINYVMQGQSTSMKSIIGDYGPWASGLLQDPPELSLRRKSDIDITELEKWRAKAMLQTETCIASPSIQLSEGIRTLSSLELDGVHIEFLEWSLSYGHSTKAIFLRPAEGSGPWPGILGLHDHGGNKYLGWRKIASALKTNPSFVTEHHQNYYGGVAWANELAKKGYAVLVHDTFTFGSRRVQLENVQGIDWGMPEVPDPPGGNLENENYINGYNNWAGAHEHVMSKSLFCAGTTWPGVFLNEDKIALDVLASRPEVKENQLGCCGLSGGGLRTVYLGGLDHRIKCAIAVGFMSTWKDFLLNKSYTHTWMTYTPLLPNYLDFPEILGLRTPLPTMVLNNNEDELFTLSEMHRSDEILQTVFDIAGASDKYQCNFYKGPHKFDLEMQQDAFAWVDKWLK